MNLTDPSGLMTVLEARSLILAIAGTGVTFWFPLTLSPSAPIMVVALTVLGFEISVTGLAEVAPSTVELSGGILVDGCDSGGPQRAAERPQVKVAVDAAENRLAASLMFAAIQRGTSCRPASA